MKILASNESDLNLLRELAGTDTWVKCVVDWGTGLHINNPVYLQVLDVYSDRVKFLYVDVDCVNGSIEYLDDPNSEWAISDIFDDRVSISIDRIILLHPYEFLETWEIQSALEFAGYPKI